MRIICHGLKEEDFPVEFTDHKIMIGRDESNSIEVAADGISRFHAVILEEGDELFLQDNNSLNGTFLNYKQISGKLKIVHGDIIQIGYRLIRVVFQSDQEVVLDFVPPEQTQIVSHDPTKAPLPVAVPASEQTPQKDDIDRTIVASETLLANSSSSKGIFASGCEIGKYTIIKRLGKGGMGEVYLAKHKTLGIFRALKMLSQDSDNSNAKFLERFIREAKLASEIRHPNVVGVMDVETDSDCRFPYIVMEYIDGGSLRNSLAASKRLSEEQAVVIVEAIASALQAAEEHNIVHRDIKPDNIMFTRRGEVKLADLGIAKVGGKDTDLTKTNMMIGTPAYLPPEQAKNAKGVDARADIYSLGATFYEMLTGEQPYPGENSIEVLHKLFLTPVPDPRKLNPEVSAASAAIVMKMMAKDPKNRFQSATELLTMLERTFPPHTTQESAELIRKVIAGDCQNDTAFSSNISLSHLSLLWLKIPHKGFVFSVTALVLACCIVSSLFLFLDKSKKPVPKLIADGDDIGNTVVETLVETTPAETGPDNETPAETEANQEKTAPSETTAEDLPIKDPANNSTPAEFSIGIKTEVGASISFTSPDGQHEWTIPCEIKDDGIARGYTTVQTPGKYTVTITKDHYQSLSRVIEVNDDMTLDLPLKPGGPLVVTTDKDVINANDGANSLREAIAFAQNSSRNAIVSFADDFEIRLSSPLTISKAVTIDGGEKRITVTGPKKAPLFRVSTSRLTLKNMTLISDCSGDGAGIMDVTIPHQNDVFGYLWSDTASASIPSNTALLELNSVKDGGNAERLWNLSGIGVILNGECHLHRLSGSNGTSVRIEAGSILEDAVLTGFDSGRKDGDLVVYGVLKNATVSDFADIHIRSGGTGEKLTVGKDGFLENCSGGTINGLSVEYGETVGYQEESVLTGTISIGGRITAPEATTVNDPVVDSKTDLVFDLTKRTEDNNLDNTSFDSKSNYTSKFDTLIDNLKPFSNAQSYTVRVKRNQSSGTYKLASNAAGFQTKMSLSLDNAVFSNVLSIGKAFSAGTKTYTLSIAEDNVLVLTIADGRTGTAGSTTSVRTEPGSNEKLQGALYLLSSQVGGRSNSVLSSGSKKYSCFDVLKKFTLGSWVSATNARGEAYYPELDQSFKRQAAPSLSHFCQDTVSWQKEAQTFDCIDTIGDAGWIAVYSGYVVAPFTGRFRFLGYCDDMMVVRFNRQIVIDYGNRSLTSGLPLLPDHGMILHSLETGERVDSGTGDLYSILTGNPTTKEEKRLLNESPLYSKNQIKFTSSSVFGSPLVSSPEISIRKGQVIPIDILIGEQRKEEFNMLLLIERLGSNSEQTVNAPQSTFLFRTTSDQPDKSEDPGNKLKGINQDAPVWKVVDSRGNPLPARRTQK